MVLIRNIRDNIPEVGCELNGVDLVGSRVLV